MLERVKPALEAGKLASSVELSEKEIPMIKGLHLLSMKPILYVATKKQEEKILMR